MDPIRVGEVINLATKLGINTKYIKSGTATLESEKYICLRDEEGGEELLTIIEVEKGFAMNRKPTKFEAAIMHTQDNTIALRQPSESGGTVITFLNFDSKSKIKQIELKEKVTFWNWVNNSKLAIVTPSQVFVADITNDRKEEKIMDRIGDIAGPVQIIGCNASSDERWYALFGISTPDGGKTINGHIQLFLTEGGRQQSISGLACTFGKAYIHNDTHQSELFCYCERKPGESAKVVVTEVSTVPEGYTKHKKTCDINFEQPNDFPIYFQVSEKYGLLLTVTKNGLVYAYQLITTQLIFRGRFGSGDSFFTCCKNSKNDGLLALSRSGSLYALAIEEASLIPFIMTKCTFLANNQQLAVEMATRYRLPGLQGLFQEQFNRLLVAGDYAGAAKVAASGPDALFRNIDTINKFKSLPQQPGQHLPILIYFQKLIEKGKLNKVQSEELASFVLSQGKGVDPLKVWYEQKKLEPSQSLGDIIGRFDKETALKVYRDAGAHGKVVAGLNELGKFQTANEYAARTGASVDYLSTLKMMIATSPDGALKYAKNLCATNKSVSVYDIAQFFAGFNRLQEMTAFLVQCMKDNKPEDGPWQTRALEVNIMAAPQVAEAIFQMGKWTQFNRYKVAVLCEQKGLYQRALQNYSEPKDIKRVLNNAHMIPEKFMQEYFTKLSPDVACPLLVDIIKYNRQNIKLVVTITVANSAAYGLHNCIKIFDASMAFDGMFFYLSSVEKGSDKEAYFKYIESAAKCNQLKIVKDIIEGKPEAYDAQRVKDLLVELKLPDPKPLICLCDIHGLVQDLVKYLYKNNQLKFLEIYLFNVNNNSAPVVFRTLIDLECEQSYIKQLLFNLRSMCPMDKVINEFVQKNRLPLLENWLEHRVQEGVQLVDVHNALARIKIDTNQEPAEFLANNQFYDSKVVGLFCEERDPHLAVTAYRRSWGKCDEELIRVTNNNALFRIQAKYLVERQSEELWRQVLDMKNPHRQQIIEQVISTALPESKNIEQISVAVKSFLTANLHTELMSLLEKIVLHHKEFRTIKKLQNLLIMTAMKSDRSRVMDYVKKLDNFDGPDIAKIALTPQYKLYEEAFAIYEKLGMNSEAQDVLITYLGNVERAHDFAAKSNQPDLWSKLGTAYLENGNTLTAVDCFIKSKDPSHYIAVIQACEHDRNFDALLRFLPMARQITKDQHIDNAYCYALASLSRNVELEQFIQQPNSCDAQRVGDRCFGDKLYEAAKILYLSVKNNAKIASCLVFLGEFSGAIEAAKRANTPRTWKDLCMACVAAKEFKLAATAGMHIIVHADHLEDLINFYESKGVPEQMISLLESGMGLERVHVGIFTELGILYGKYRPEKLIHHCKTHLQSMNIPKLLRVTEKYGLWQEAVFLHSSYNDADKAAAIMMEHSPTCFEHEVFVNLMNKVSNTDLHYKAIQFYLEEQPMLINDLLKGINKKLDLVRCVSALKKTGYLPLVTPFLKLAQPANSREVNESLHEIYIEECDSAALRESISHYDNFDALSLARATQKHPRLQFRRIAALLYRKLNRFEESINISKSDNQFRDVIETARDSQKMSLVESVLKFFVERGDKQFFAVTLYTCFQFLKPDLVLELAWKNGMTDWAMPYMIQIMKDLYTKIDTVQKKHEDREKKEELAAKQSMAQSIDVYPSMMGGTPMLMSGPATGFPLDPMMMGGVGGMTGMGMSGMSGMSSMSGMSGMGSMQAPMGSGFGQFSSWTG